MFSFEFDAEKIFDEYLRDNQDSIRSEMENIARQRIADVIGPENMSKVTVTFTGTDLEDLKMHVEGPDDLKVKIEEALCSGTL